MTAAGFNPQAYSAAFNKIDSADNVFNLNVNANGEVKDKFSFGGWFRNLLANESDIQNKKVELFSKLNANYKDCIAKKLDGITPAGATAEKISQMKMAVLGPYAFKTVDDARSFRQNLILLCLIDPNGDPGIVQTFTAKRHGNQEGSSKEPPSDKDKSTSGDGADVSHLVTTKTLSSFSRSHGPTRRPPMRKQGPTVQEEAASHMDSADASGKVPKDGIMPQSQESLSQASSVQPEVQGPKEKTPKERAEANIEVFRKPFSQNKNEAVYNEIIELMYKESEGERAVIEFFTGSFLKGFHANIKQVGEFCDQRLKDIESGNMTQKTAQKFLTAQVNALNGQFCNQENLTKAQYEFVKLLTSEFQKKIETKIEKNVAKFNEKKPLIKESTEPAPSQKTEQEVTVAFLTNLKLRDLNDLLVTGNADSNITSQEGRAMAVTYVSNCKVIKSGCQKLKSTVPGFIHSSKHVAVEPTLNAAKEIGQAYGKRHLEKLLKDLEVSDKINVDSLGLPDEPDEYV